MKTYTLRDLILAAGFAVTCASFLANSSGPSSDYSGSPFSATNACATCHSGNYNPGTGLTLSGLPANYVPGTAYTLTLSIDNATGKNGFQGIALRSSNNAVAGSFTASTGMQIKTISGRNYIQHNAGSSTGSWTFTWTAPSNYQGSLNFYFSGNATNSSNSTAGDAVYTGTFSTTTSFTALTATTSKTNVNCNGACDGTASVTVSGGSSPYTYTWSGGTQVSGQPNAVTNLCNGSYTVTIEDDNGVEITKTINISQPPALTANASSSTPATCAQSDGEANVAAGGGTSPYSFAWSNGGTGATISNVPAGTYYVTVTDANLCTSVDTVDVVDGASGLTANMSSTDAHCGQADGQAEVSMQTGVSPYSFVWSSGGTDFIETGLSAGAYSVTVTDGNGCVDSFNVVVGNIDGPSVSASIAEPITCFGTETGSASVEVTGGNPPYTFMWNTGSADSLLTGVGVGTYDVDVMDANGCLTSGNVTITGPSAALEIAEVQVDDDIDGNCNGAIEVSVSGDYAQDGYSVVWDDPNQSTGDVVSNLCAGVYQGIATDIEGCTDSILVEVDLSPTSVFELDSRSVKLFPNPTHSQLVIELPNQEATQIVVYSLKGEQFINQSFETDLIRLSLNHLPTGLYIIQVVQYNSTITKRINKL